MTPHRQEEAKKRVPAHVRVVVDVHCPVCGASFDDIVRSGRAGSGPRQARAGPPHG